jgi:hypothetical protein
VTPNAPINQDGYYRQDITMRLAHMAIPVSQDPEGFQLANRILDDNSVVTETSITRFLGVSQRAPLGFLVGQDGQVLLLDPLEAAIPHYGFIVS